MSVVSRLEALAEKGYIVGVGAVDDAGEPLSYRVVGFGLDTTVAVGAEDVAAELVRTHDERAKDAPAEP